MVWLHFKDKCTLTHKTACMSVILLLLFLDIGNASLCEIQMMTLPVWQIYELAKETVYLLLDFNPDVQGLLDWVIDRCYTGQKEVADGCFNALAAVFQTK